MKRNAKVATALMSAAVCATMVFSGCAPTTAEATELRMATGYNSADTGLTFSSAVAGEGITLADGKTYNTGDLKPTWVEVENRLNIKFTDMYQGNNTAKEFAYWKDQLDQVDMVSGTASDLTEAGNSGLVLNIADYLDKMPNFKKYLDDNPIVRLSITGSTTGDSAGAIYFSPYFDGVDDIERMPLMRTDWVVKLLDGSTAFTATTSANLKTAKYTPYMPTSGSVEVDVVKADGVTTEKLTKDYSKYGNIVEKMNAAGSISGVDAVNMLREYIDKTYNNYYGTKRSDLFCGQNAAWDADEVVALLRCVCANAQTLNGTDSIQGIFSREEGQNQRRVDMFRLAGTMFGVRGLESRNDYYYFDKAGNLVDARVQKDTYDAMDRMNALYQEGLISSDFNKEGVKTKSENYLEKDNGFMSYDYNQTQTLMNETKLQEGENYTCVMVPVARWNDGSASPVYMRFTESWRSVKTDGWAISKAGVGNDESKINACISLIDFAYSEAGQILMSYGPDSFIDVKDATKTAIAEKYNCFNFNGKQMPKISQATNDELWAKAGGNYTNYARKYLGSTLSFVKSQAFEFQCTCEAGRTGAQLISNAIAAGTIKHPLLSVNTENMWYTSMPTVFPTTATENTSINGYTSLASNDGKFSQSKDKSNILVDIITSGYTGEGTATQADTITTVKATWGADAILSIRKAAWTRLKTYYDSLSK